MTRSFFVALAALALSAAAARAQIPGNLLRNGDFQDDWITLLPETKNHHWCFPSEFFNRRDFNPDGWTCKGSWHWLNPEAPRGQRRLMLQGPGAEVMQRVNWVAIHDDRQLEGFPDAGGYPVTKSARSRRPERLTRDLKLLVHVAGKDVPKGGGSIKLGLCQPGAASTADPMGVLVPPLVSVSVSLPEGTYQAGWVELKLPASEWLKAAAALAAKDPKEAAEAAKEGTRLPGIVMASIHYTGKTGSCELGRAELLATATGTANLLPNYGFEDPGPGGYPAGWSPPFKYRYFPPRHYYIFNTWHNTNFANRGGAAADELVLHGGKRSLRMTVPSGDETAVQSDPVVLNQKEPRLIEAQVWVKTDRLCMMQIDAVDEKGQRLDGFNLIHKAPASIGTDDWRLVRQVFRPRAPVQSVRLQLCARGVNGYTLDDTGEQPQNNVVGTVWWDDVHLSEPESDLAELAARGVKSMQPTLGWSTPHVAELDLGERLLGENTLRAVIANNGSLPGPFSLRWDVISPSGKKSSSTSKPVDIINGRRLPAELTYTLTEPCPAYTEYRGTLTLLDGKGNAAASSEIPFGTWTTPIDLELGALYLRPDQKQFVRMNLGFTAATMAKLKTIKLELLRRGTGQVLKVWDVDASRAAVAAQRQKIPAELRDDFANLLLADLDLSMLPVQPFIDPQRNWLLRATAVLADGTTMGQATSQPFCRQGHEPPQPAVQSVAIKGNLVYVDGQPWLPWGVTYGHTPAYDGPADPGPGKYRDLQNLPGWSMYDRHSSASSVRKLNDFNCLRYVAGSVSDPKLLQKRWKEDNLYCSTAFATPQPVFSPEELFKAARGRDKLDAYLAFCRSAPMVVSVTPGIEEAFGLFQGATPQQLKGMEQAVDYLRKQSGKPVMVGHGGYWNRFEFERARFFDIFDPETEPLYPANLHTDLAPLVADKDKVVWLRPQMYESIPYERWRFHVFVELMRGCRGWQVAHGPGDTSLFRGLHGEVEFFKPIVASADLGPRVETSPRIEHWSRRHAGKAYVVAATTRGIPLGKWEWTDDAPDFAKRSRVTSSRHELRDESNAYAIGQDPDTGAAIHGIQYVPDAKAWPKGTKLVQWVKLDQKAAPRGLTVLVKADGRWTHAAGWGETDLAAIRSDPKRAYWFLNSFYRHAKGFLGWGTDLVGKSLEYVPDKATDFGPLPAVGRWVKLEVPLDKVGAADKLLDGVGFLHDGGRVTWGHTALDEPDGKAHRVWGDSVELPQDALAKTTIRIDGLKAGTKVRVLFEDREITAGDGFFVDDFRGRDLYQRHGGGFGTGYGDAPVALHLYEVPAAR